MSSKSSISLQSFTKYNIQLVEPTLNYKYAHVVEAKHYKSNGQIDTMGCTDLDCTFWLYHPFQSANQLLCHFVNHVLEYIYWTNLTDRHTNKQRLDKSHS